MSRRPRNAQSVETTTTVYNGLVTSMACPTCKVKGHVRSSTTDGVTRFRCDFCVPVYFWVQA